MSSTSSTLIKAIKLALTITITLISLLGTTNSQSTCGRANPADNSGCSKFDSANKACCFMYTDTAKICGSIDISLKATITTFDIKGVTYKVDCSMSSDAAGVVSTSTEFGGTCAVYPTKIADCTSKSISSSSCCLTTTNDVNYCVWMGEKISSSTHTSWGKTFYCSAEENSNNAMIYKSLLGSFIAMITFISFVVFA